MLKSTNDFKFQNFDYLVKTATKNAQNGDHNDG